MVWNEEKLLPILRATLILDASLTISKPLFCALFRWQVLLANAELISEGFFLYFSFLSVSQSSIPLKEVIRKIINNSLKLTILFFNILYSNCGFQMECTHMSVVWNWTTTTLKSSVFFITLLPVYLSAWTGSLFRQFLFTAALIHNFGFFSD